MILRAGLTGGIASGKSTVGKMFARLGAQVIDADAVVSALYRPGEAGFEAILNRYGKEVLRADGEIDRQKLSEIALATAESAKELNALIHPLVIAEEGRMISLREEDDQDQVVMVEATLLLESGGRERYHRIIVVDLDPETQIERAVSRGLTRDEAMRRMARQMPREERLRQADYVIDNRGSQEQTERQTREVYGKLQWDLRSLKDSQQGSS